MTCDYCFYCDEAKKRTQHVYGMMNEKTLETIIEKTISEADAVASFTWQGGEPTLRGIDFFEKAGVIACVAGRTRRFYSYEQFIVVAVGVDINHFLKIARCSALVPELLS